MSAAIPFRWATSRNGAVGSTILIPRRPGLRLRPEVRDVLDGYEEAWDLVAQDLGVIGLRTFPGRSPQRAT